jgi:hypothetical protein
MKKDRLAFSLLISFKIKKVPLNIISCMIENGTPYKEKSNTQKPNIDWLTN